MTLDQVLNSVDRYHTDPNDPIPVIINPKLTQLTNEVCAEKFGCRSEEVKELDEGRKE